MSESKTRDAILRSPYSIVVLGILVAIPFIFPAWSDNFVLQQEDWGQRTGKLEYWDALLYCYTWVLSPIVALINPLRLPIGIAPWRSAMKYTLAIAVSSFLLFYALPAFDGWTRERDPLFLAPDPNIDSPSIQGFVTGSLVFLPFPLMITGCALWVRSDYRRALR